MNRDNTQQDVHTSHIDRETVARQLATAASEGHISTDELEKRLDRTHEAQTYAQLHELVQDLPGGDEPAVRTVPEHTIPESLHVVAALRDARMDGQWTVPPRIMASAGRGTVHLDFTEATVPYGEVTVDARPNLSNIEITVPEGYRISWEEATPGSSAVRDLTAAESSPDSPRLHIVSEPGLGGIHVRHPKRDSQGSPRRRRRRWFRRGG